MKKILVVIPSFDIGGTIVSLHSLLSLINTSQVEVDIFARSRSGVYLNHFPNCKILEENIWLSSKIYNKSLISKIIFIILKRLRNILGIININLYPLYSYIGGKCIGSNRYDNIISYQEDLNRVICYYPAKRRTAWIHCEYSRYLKLLGKNDEAKFYKRFNNIVCVSKFAKDSFCNVHPEFKDKTTYIYNIINKDEIIRKARDCSQLDNRFISDVFTIVSVGRMDIVKQFEKIPEIAKKIRDHYRVNFRWYIVGGPNDSILLKKINKTISTLGLEDVVICLGEKDNPYPYIDKADLLVHTSRSEAFSLVVHEANALSKPVVINDIEVAYEFIASNKNGSISSIENMPDVIYLYIKNKLSFVSHNSFNAESIQKFYSIL